MTFLTEEALAAHLGCSRAKLRADRRKGRGIPYLRIGKLVRYAVADVEKWVDAKTVRPK